LAASAEFGFEAVKRRKILPGNYFWSATENSSNSANAWNVNLNNGNTNNNNKSTNRYNVRCVRR
jgi:uncharacterized protein (TIGR02145 family)